MYRLLKMVKFPSFFLVEQRATVKVSKDDAKGIGRLLVELGVNPKKLGTLHVLFNVRRPFADNEVEVEPSDT